MRVLFVAGFAPIVRDPAAARALFADTLGLTFEGGQGDYPFTEKLGGTKHFGLWPLTEAAEACFGKKEWPREIPAPQASIEFEVDDVAAAARELEQRGYKLVHGARTEPWKQIVARLLTPEGLLIGVCHTPWLHEKK
jgi:catechol 2,3-dioxygenase-like lactoylglutathione lyase family enzyme